MKWVDLRCLQSIIAVVLAASFCACGDGDGSDDPPFIAVLSAFPAELAPLLEQATVRETIVVEDRTLRVGTLAGVPVVLGLTGIGLVNASATTRAVLEHFAVTGIIVSGVGGSPLRIGDVVVPAVWTLDGDVSYTVHPPFTESAREIAASLSFERCTLLPMAPPEEPPVCLAHEPVLAVGGLGRSSDPFGGRAFRCVPGSGDIFGCDVNDTGSASERDREAYVHLPASELEELVLEDMETAAIAREAAERGVPFIAFRGVSDGTGDPLSLPGFPAQFFTYYRLAAGNAAAAALAFLERVRRADKERFFASGSE